MSDAIVQKGEQGLRPPSNLREILALALALVIVLAIIQLGAPLVRQLTFIDEKIRDSVIGLAFFAFPAINRTIKQLLDRSSGSRLVRPDLSPWFVTGIFAATLMFAWNQFVSFVGALAVYAILGQIVDAETLSQHSQTVAQGLSMIAIPMALVAGVYGGMLLNRYTRSLVMLAVLLGALGLMALNIGTTFLLAPSTFEMAVNTAGGLVGLVSGFAILATIILIALSIGVVISRINRDRSIGRLLNAARKLSPEDRDEVTADVLQRLGREQ